MNEEAQNQNLEPTLPADTEVIALIKKMQQQLTFLEKKLDILINQSQEKPFREKNFEKPFRSFDRPHHRGSYHEKRGHGEGFRDRGYHSGQPGQRSEERPEEGYRESRGPKKSYGSSHGEGFGSQRPFKKKFGGEKEGFRHRKKNFFQGHRKNRPQF